jgi:hypothetical protein
MSFNYLNRFPLEMQVVYKRCGPQPGVVAIILLFDIARTPKEIEEAGETFRVIIICNLFV